MNPQASLLNAGWCLGFNFCGAALPEVLHGTISEPNHVSTVRKPTMVGAGYFGSAIAPTATAIARADCWFQ
jgi:hypothetical protein